MSKLTTRSTSYNSAKVEQVLIIDETATTRRVFRAEINDVKVSTGETLSGTIIHQRKGLNDKWEDIEAIDLTRLKAGDGIKIHLRSTPLKRLFDGLQQLYCLSQKGVFLGEREFVVEEASKILSIPENRKLFVQKLLEQDFGEEIWKELVDNNPNLVTRLSRARIQQERSEALAEFENSLADEELDESYWQKFFQSNQWLFGFGLNYQFNSVLSDQPHIGGINYTGLGTQRGDFLLSSIAAAKFTCLVEIKKPFTKLLFYQKGQPFIYRNGACLISSELSGAVSQIQVNCKTWQETALNTQNDRTLHPLNIHTIQPKGILVIGRTEELITDTSVATFELYRRNIYNPEIITFDELLARARFIVANEQSDQKSQTEEEIIF
ncbi:MAG: DUF4263 domain-containing protein [Ignavibacteriales bacterium]|nr:DUF4263 domain-containing protein [Ignavibacteriales bacterium]